MKHRNMGKFDEKLTELENSVKSMFGAEDVIANWDSERKEMHLEIYYTNARYKVLHFTQSFSISNF